MFFYSLVVPGAGQLAQGEKRGFVYIMAELALWGGFYLLEQEDDLFVFFLVEVDLSQVVGDGVLAGGFREVFAVVEDELFGPGVFAQAQGHHTADIGLIRTGHDAAQDHLVEGLWLEGLTQQQGAASGQGQTDQLAKFFPDLERKRAYAIQPRMAAPFSLP